MKRYFISAKIFARNKTHLDPRVNKLVVDGIECWIVEMETVRQERTKEGATIYTNEDISYIDERFDGAIEFIQSVKRECENQ